MALSIGAIRPMQTDIKEVYGGVHHEAVVVLHVSEKKSAGCVCSVVMLSWTFGIHVFCEYYII